MVFFTPENMKISIAKEFSDVPWGRFPSDSDFCGQNFRDQLLLPAIKKGHVVEVDLDGVEGFGSSFLEEAFGGLVRKGITEDQLKRCLKIVTNTEEYKMYADIVWKYIREAQQTRENSEKSS